MHIKLKRSEEHFHGASPSKVFYHLTVWELIQINSHHLECVKEVPDTALEANDCMVLVCVMGELARGIEALSISEVVLIALVGGEVELAEEGALLGDHLGDVFILIKFNMFNLSLRHIVLGSMIDISNHLHWECIIGHGYSSHKWLVPIILQAMVDLQGADLRDSVLVEVGGGEVRNLVKLLWPLQATKLLAHLHLLLPTLLRDTHESVDLIPPEGTQLNIVDIKNVKGAGDLSSEADNSTSCAS